MKSKAFEQLEHYFRRAIFGAVEPIESLTGNISVISEHSEGI